MVVKVTTFEETKAFSCSGLDVKDDAYVNSKAGFKHSI